jgi:transposase
MSENQKNNYPLEFKVLSAQLAVDSEQPVAQNARDLGINRNTLHDWIDKYSNSNDCVNKSRVPKFPKPIFLINLSFKPLKKHVVNLC